MPDNSVNTRSDDVLAHSLRCRPTGRTGISQVFVVDALLSQRLLLQQMADPQAMTYVGPGLAGSDRHSDHVAAAVSVHAHREADRHG